MQYKQSKWSLTQRLINQGVNRADYPASVKHFPVDLLPAIQRTEAIKQLKLKRIQAEIARYPSAAPKDCVLQYIDYQIDVHKTISVWLVSQVKKGNIPLSDTSPFYYILAGHRNDGLLEELWNCYDHKQQQAFVDRIMRTGVLLDGPYEEEFAQLLSRNNVEFCEMIWMRATPAKRNFFLSYFSLLHVVVERSALSALDWFWSKTNLDQRKQQSIRSSEMLSSAVSTGNLSVCQWVYNHMVEVVPAVDVLKDALSLALEHCYFDIAKWLWDTADAELKMKMIFCVSVGKLTRDDNVLPRITWLFENLDANYINAIFLEGNCYLFRFACVRANAQLVRFLWNNANDKQKPILYSSVNLDEVLAGNPVLREFKECVKDIKESCPNSKPATDPAWKQIGFFDVIVPLIHNEPNFIDPDDQDEYNYEIELRK